MFRPLALWTCVPLIAVCAPVAAAGDCDSCDLPQSCREENSDALSGVSVGSARCQRLEIVIESDVHFGRVVVLGKGEGRVLLDLDSGERRMIGDVDDLGGVPITGRALVTGTPFEALRINLPGEVDMRDRTGATARLSELTTDLPALPRLDANGQLVFHFSGTLIINAKTQASGRLRGRVPITVEYQ